MLCPGDVVRFREGAKPMTVEAVFDNGDAHVVWFDRIDNDKWRGPFRALAFSGELVKMNVADIQREEVRYAIWSSLSNVRNTIKRKLYKA